MTLLQPFVWIYAVTPNDSTTKKVIPLTSDVLISMTDEGVFDLGASPSSERVRTARLKLRLVIFDKDFTYWETLFVMNKRRLEVEYGWLNEDGTVASSSGVVAVTLTQIGPKFTHQGTELEILAVSDLTSTVAPGSEEFFYASRSFGITFVPDTAGSPYPSPLLSNPSIQNQREDLRVKFRTGSFGLQIPIVSDALIAAADDFNERASKLSNPLELLDPTRKVYTYSSIGQLVRDIASMLGLKSDVDDTAPATQEIMCNCTLTNMLSKLAQYAKSPTGEMDYRFWVRGSTVYFKRAKANVKDKKILEFNSSQNLSLASSVSGSSLSRIVLGVDLKINPYLLVSSSRAGVVTTSFDDKNKVMRGGNVAPPWRNIKETLSRTIGRKVSKKLLNGQTEVIEYEATYTPPEGMTAATATKADERFYAQKWLIWDTAVELADPLVDSAIASETADAQREGVPFRSNFDDIRSQVRIAAFQLLTKENQDRLGDTGDATAEIDVNQSLYTEALKNPSIKLRDETMTGRLYPTAFQGEHAANLSKVIMQDIAEKVITADVFCAGDVTIRLMDVVTLVMATPTGQHYASGDYLVLGFNNTIDRQGFTSKLSLVSLGAVSGSPQISDSTIQNSKTRPPGKPPATTWTDIKKPDSTIPIDDPVEEDKQDYLADKIGWQRKL